MQTLTRTSARREFSRAVIERDGYCTVAEFDHRPCSGPLQACHITPVRELEAEGRWPWNPAEGFAACARHHALYDALQRRSRQEQMVEDLAARARQVIRSPETAPTLQAAA